MKKSKNAKSSLEIEFFSLTLGLVVKFLFVVPRNRFLEIFIEIYVLMAIDVR
jgi:hypothetical protein